MSSFSKLGIIFTSLSSLFFLVAVILYAVYLLLRRRRSTTTPSTAPGIDVLDFDNRCSSHHSCLSEDLLLPTYLLCCKKRKRTRIEPSGAPATGLLPTADITVEPSELMKIQGISMSSRVLFTIREEERDDVLGRSSPSEMSSSMGRRKVAVEEDRCWHETIELIEGLEPGFETPSESPCASPPYYTPPPSPSKLG